MEEITFVVKTFERPNCLLRLVKSIYKYYSDAIVIIGDDSKNSAKKTIEKRYRQKKISFFELPYDCGISYGRNYLVRKVETKYFVLLDDDYVFDKFTEIEKGLNIIKNKQLDLLGGFFRNYPVIHSFIEYPRWLMTSVFAKEQKKNYIGSIEENDDEVIVRYYTEEFPKYQDVDIIHNFFIARRDAILDNCMWDESIKVNEHTPFFIRAKRCGLKVGFSAELSILHKPVCFKKYIEFRDRNYVKEWMTLYGFKHYVSIVNEHKEAEVTL